MFGCLLTACNNADFVFVCLKDNIPDSSLRKLKKYIEDPRFYPEIAEKSSKVRNTLINLFFIYIFVEKYLL